MKLKKVHVTDYKSIRDSREFEIGDITCLIGKNESGKTSLLEALYRLNPLLPDQGNFDVTEDYPRSTVEDYRQEIEAKKKSHTIVVHVEFALEDVDLAEVRATFGSNALKCPVIKLSKGYENKLNYTLEIDENEAVQGLIASFQLPPEVATVANNSHTIADLAIFLSEKSREQNQAHEAAIKGANAMPDSGEKAKAMDQANLLSESEAAKSLRTFLEELKKTNLPTYFWNKYFKDRVPKFLYFDEYYQMKGTVNIEKLRERQSKQKLDNSDHPMLGLIGLSRLKIEELLEPNRTLELINKIEGASNHLSKQILKYWSQNKHIRIRFDVRPARPGDPEELKPGTNLWGFVYDDVHEVSTNLGRRSRGFVWFFSFLAWYSLQKRENQSIILLLDEPGLFLHAKAQGDFLKYMEVELKGEHQILFSTHSPFMIDPTHFERVRIVEDKSMTSDEQLPPDQQGTKVTSDVLEVDDATLFPLQGALGYEISQTLFVGPNSLIMEGSSDLLYIQSMSAALQKLGRTSLRKEWTITPVGGADKVPTFAALIGVQRGINVATLIDFQKSHRQSIENLYKRKLLAKSHVFTFADFTGTSEADIEDMFEPDFYLQLVSAEYASDLKKPIAMADLTPGGSRILPRVEALIAAKSPGLHFDHYRPASYLASNMATLAVSLSPATLDRFEKAFVALNNLLPIVK